MANPFSQAKQLWDLQRKAKAIQKELKETEIEAKSGDGRITVVFNGEQHIQDIQIDSSLLNPDNKHELEKNLKTVIAEALSRAQALAADRTKDVMKDMNLNIPGL